MDKPEMWGVTVDEVSALAPHITIKADPSEPLTADVTFGAATPRAITVEQVETFIQDVAARVALRTLKVNDESVPDAAIRDLINKARHDVTRNGAASYLVAAAFPAKAGLNDQSSLSAELWQRFLSGLAELVTIIDELTAPDAVIPGVDSPLSNVTEGFFQAPIFPDLPAEVTYRDCPYPGSWSW